ncbi:MAG: hypothetical protein ABJL55_23520 [Roseibium sp.]
MYPSIPAGLIAGRAGNGPVSSIIAVQLVGSINAIVAVDPLLRCKIVLLAIEILIELLLGRGQLTAAGLGKPPQLIGLGFRQGNACKDDGQAKQQ